MQQLKQQLEEELATVTWNSLTDHAKRDGIIIIDSALNLIEAGIAIATDNSSLVQGWIEKKLITKPSIDQLNIWNQHPEKEFQTIIVQPFVLIQKK